MTTRKSEGNGPEGRLGSPWATPRFYRWGGPKAYRWAFGWETGEDGDLVCMRRVALTKVEGEIALSPVCSNRLLAFFAFIMKRILTEVDLNLRGLEG